MDLQFTISVGNSILNKNMNNLIKSLSLAVLFSTIILAAGCGSSNEPAKPSTPSPSPTPVAEEANPEEEVEVDPTLDMDGPSYGLQVMSDDVRAETDRAFGKIKVTDVRTIDFWKLPYHVALGTEIPYTKEDITIEKTFGDIDGDGKDEVFILIDEVPRGSGTFAHGLLLGINQGKLKVLAIMPDGQRFASEWLGELLGGHITNGEVRVFRWAWDDLYSPKDDSKPMKDIMVTTVYRIRNGRLASESVSGIFIKEFPVGYWPKEPNIMSAKREAEFIRKAKIGDVDLERRFR